MNWAFWLLFPVTFGTLLASALAYALRTISSVTLEKELNRQGRGQWLEPLLRDQEQLALVASTARIICNVSLVALTIRSLDELNAAPSALTFVIGAAIAAVILLVFSVAIANAWAIYAGEAIVAFFGPTFLIPLHRLCFPLILFLKLFDGLVRRLCGVTDQSLAQGEAVENKEEFLAAVSEGAVDEDQKKMIEGVMSFQDLQVSQIMTPRTDMVTISIHSPLEEIREKILRDGLSRLPVHDGNLDNILGLLYAKDLLALPRTADADQSFNVRSMMRPPLFVPHTKPLRDLLRQFRLQRVHMAIVLDEFGGTAGLVTSEDILEEIVGDIADEFETPAARQFRRVSPTIIELDGRTNITDINRELDLHLLESQDYQTISGLIINQLGTIPVKGVSIDIDNLRLTVTESDARRIRKVQIIMPDQAEQLTGAADTGKEKSGN